MGTIQQYTIKQGTNSSIRLDGGTRCVIRVETNDVRIAYEPSYLSGSEFFTIKAGEVLVFDPGHNGNVSGELGSLFWCTCTGANATLTVWSQGRGV